jgi:ferredoxin
MHRTRDLRIDRRRRVFEVQDDGTVLIHENERPESDRDRVQQAVMQCPAAALRLVD